LGKDNKRISATFLNGKD